MKVFIDFDDVIFNTGQFKADLKALFLAEGVSEEMFDAHYYDSGDMRKLKMFDPALHALRIEKATGVSMKVLLENIEVFLTDVSRYVFDDVIGFFESIGKKNIYLISYGDEKFIKLKAEGAGVMKYVTGIKVAQGKKSEVIKEIILMEKFPLSEKIFFLDDRIEQISDIKKELPQIITLLVKRPQGRYDDPKEFCCDWEVKDLHETWEIIEKFV